jgi:hypothetical protein
MNSKTHTVAKFEKKIFIGMLMVYLDKKDFACTAPITD